MASDRPEHVSRVAVVTGGASGIGEAVALRLARAGHRVAIADLVDAGHVAASHAANQSSPGEVASFIANVAVPEDLAILRQQIEDRWGPVDVVVANAGIYPVAPFDDLDFDTWKRVFAVNTDSFFHLLKTFLPGMRARAWGRVIAVATNLVYNGLPQGAAYVASKAAVVGVIRSVTDDLGRDGITINAVAPGLVRTPGAEAVGEGVESLIATVRELQAIPRTGLAPDLAGIVNFLAGDESSWLTGQTIAVDGGVAHT